MSAKDNDDLRGKRKRPPRNEVAVGISGPIGQTFGIMEKNWSCPRCGNSNFATRNHCYICREKKPVGGGGLKIETALARDQVCFAGTGNEMNVRQ